MTTSYPDDADGDVLTAMAESGIDMTEELTIEFIIDAPGEQKAKAIEADVAAAGYPAMAEFEDGDPEEGIDPGWVVSIEIEMAPDYDSIVDLQKKLQGFAEVHGGQVDGWGAMIDEDDMPDGE
ncbi:MAG: regulator of RNase E activity RraB [Planctomycetota bacterium]|jgi:regulator of RNase E activity RraB